MAAPQAGSSFVGVTPTVTDLLNCFVVNLMQQQYFSTCSRLFVNVSGLYWCNRWTNFETHPANRISHTEHSVVPALLSHCRMLCLEKALFHPRRGKTVWSLHWAQDTCSVSDTSSNVSTSVSSKLRHAETMSSGLLQ